ncbi:hypothetical protein [Leucobacter chromiireducens]|uniref:Alpha/beta hydrolase n=1 Tax=Leucobacter chromiireducens subsp. solipictus TaxID=398235 RepID=A0ABS1SER8_9MICO|nr:hypothetical protein [Leucobacter chromiireducens]MBL3678802.1 hypothetical protein [Leucobacter chromiireducens subsp. solipictus]
MPVQFDEVAAERFTRAARTAAEELHAQAAPRRAAAEYVLTGCVGPVVRLLERVCAGEADDRGTLAGVLIELAEQVQQAQVRAREERTRQRLLSEWEARQVLRAHELTSPVAALMHASGLAHPSPLNGDPRPSTVAIAPPTLSARFSARRRVREPHRTAEGRSGATPEQLMVFVSRSRASTRQLEGQLSAVWNAWTGVLTSSPWVRVESVTVLHGFQAYLAENEADAQWVTRVAEAFVAAGGGVLHPSAMRGLATTRPRDRDTVELLASLATASDADVVALRAALPGLGVQVQQLDARTIAAWWARMAAGDSGDGQCGDGQSGDELSPRQALLLRSMPEVWGSLDGLPVAARIRANALRVPGLIREVRAELRDLDGAGTSAGNRRAELLRNELAYLGRVGNGEVQLVLYDRGESRIVEALGSPTAATQRAVTYVPGTYTGMDSFFTGRVQQIGHALIQGTPGTLVFVYKDGLFPGEEPSGRGPQALRIREANHSEVALRAGEQLSRFGAALRSDPALASVTQIGIGHSWGLANLTASEIAGARYDTVISLSGAGMPADWRARATTGYFDLSYPDILQGAQRQGYVWRGNTPRNHPGFAKFPLYQGPDDGVLASPSLRDTPEKLRVLTRNHDLIVTASPANRRILEDVRRLVSQ